MPYRRLPTTDQARLRALKRAVEKADQTEAAGLAFSDRFIHPVRNLHDQLKTLKHQRDESWKQIVRQNKTYQKAQEKARMLLSHFVQVLNFAIDREELTPETRRFYGIDPDQATVPRMLSAEELLEWGKKIIEGEGKRTRMGGAPIMSPTIGKVRVWYDRFRDIHHSQEVAKKSYQRAVSQVSELRRKADQMIQLLWNDVEEHYAPLPDPERRERCSDYGVVYVFRKKEKTT